MRARASTIGLNAGCVGTSSTLSPSIHTTRPSRSASRYSSPVLIMRISRIVVIVSRCVPEREPYHHPSMPRPRTNPEPDTPKVLDKALRVLEAFDEQSPEWAESELHDRLAIPSTTLNRIIRGLERAGYLLRAGDGRYRLGIAAARLGARASASLNLPAVLEPQLRELGRRTEELVILAVPELSTGRARYVAIADSPKRLRVTAEVGT